jgi:hypothetical protein
MAKRKNVGGRPPAGPGGERVRGYRHQLTSRLRGDSFHTLNAIKEVTARSYRGIITDAINLYLAQHVSKSDRERIALLSAEDQRDCKHCKAERGSNSRT